jgi:hypothetical protein
MQQLRMESWSQGTKKSNPTTSLEALVGYKGNDNY